MSFDRSIENLILEENKKKKINNILHIGACLGEELDFYKKLNPQKIYWFEPNPKLLSELTKNVTNQSFESLVFPYAVSNKKGSTEFNIIENSSKTNPGCSSLQNLKLHSNLYPNIKKVDTCTVETINLDEFLIQNNLETSFDLVSLDTQGHDYEVLTSSQFILESFLMVIETSSIELYEGQKTDVEIGDFLSNYDYIKDYYHPFHSVWGDTLFVKKF